MPPRKALEERTAKKDKPLAVGCEEDGRPGSAFSESDSLEERNQSLTLQNENLLVELDCSQTDRHIAEQQRDDALEQARALREVIDSGRDRINHIRLGAAQDKINQLQGDLDKALGANSTALNSLNNLLPYTGMVDKAVEGPARRLAFAIKRNPLLYDDISESLVNALERAAGHKDPEKALQLLKDILDEYDPEKIEKPDTKTAAVGDAILPAAPNARYVPRQKEKASIFFKKHWHEWIDT